MPCCAQEVAHRRIDVLVRAAHVVALALQHRRERGHRRAADADQMNARHRSLDSHCRFFDRSSIGPRRRRRRARRTPNGSVSVAPGGVAGRKTEQHRAGEIRQRVARRQSRAVGPPPARRTAAARRRRSPTPARSMPVSRSCVSIRSIRYGRSADFVEEQHAARAAGRTRTACRATPSSCVSVPPTSIPARLAGAQRLEPAGARSRPSARRGTAAQERVAIVARRAARQPSLEHRPVKRHDAAAARSATSGATCCRCSR